MSLIPALGRQRQAISEFKASLVYKVSSRTARKKRKNKQWKINSEVEMRRGIVFLHLLL